MQIRRYGCTEEEADGRDEGGNYKVVEVPDIPRKLTDRMPRCCGCRDNFYNGRWNIGGSTCWSLDTDENFDGSGKPKCWR